MLQITVLVDGQRHEIGGRVALIVRWLLQHLEQVNNQAGDKRGKIVLSYKGKSLTVSFEQIEDL